MSDTTGLLWLLKETLNFDSIPPPMDYENYGKALLICCKGDGEIVEAERAWVIGYFSAYGCPADVIEKLKVYSGGDNIDDVVSSSEQLQATRQAALYDAIRASAADGELAQGEIDVIKRMGVDVGVDGAAVDAIITVYNEEEAVKAKRQKLTYPDGTPY